MTKWIQKFFATLCALTLLVSCAFATGIDEKAENPDIQVEGLNPEEISEIIENAEEEELPAKSADETPAGVEQTDDKQGDETLEADGTEVVISEVKTLADEIEQQEEEPAEDTAPATDEETEPTEEPEQEEEKILSLKEGSPKSIRGMISLEKPYIANATDEYSRTVLFTLTVPVEDCASVILNNKTLTLTKADTEEICYTFTLKLNKDQVTTFSLTTTSETSIPFALTISRMPKAEETEEEPVAENEEIGENAEELQEEQEKKSDEQLEEEIEENENNEGVAELIEEAEEHVEEPTEETEETEELAGESTEEIYEEPTEKEKQEEKSVEELSEEVAEDAKESEEEQKGEELAEESKEEPITEVVEEREDPAVEAEESSEEQQDEPVEEQQKKETTEETVGEAEEITEEFETEPEQSSLISDDEMLKSGYKKIRVIRKSGTDIFIDLEGIEVATHIDLGMELWAKPTENKMLAEIYSEEATENLFIQWNDVLIVLEEITDEQDEQTEEIIPNDSNEGTDPDNVLQETEEEFLPRSLVLSSTINGMHGVVAYGTPIKLTAELVNFRENDLYSCQWRYSPDGENYYNVEGATELEYFYALSRDNLFYRWQFVIILEDDTE